MNPLLIRRRGMMAQGGGGGSIGDYIQNGLVFHLDGIEKGVTNNAWTDRIGGIVFTSSNAEELVNSWRTGSGKKLINSSSFVFDSRTNTIEVVMERESPNSTQSDIFSSLDTSCIILSVDSGYIYISHRNEPGFRLSSNTPGLTSIAPYCVSARQNLAVVNGVSKTTTGNASIGSSTYNSIGSRGNGNYPFSGKIYAVRIYDRFLSESEMLHNQTVDNIRFNLGLNL